MRRHASIPAVLIALALTLTGAARPALAQSTPPVPADTVAGIPVRGLAAILLGETLLESERGGDAAAAARRNRAAEIAARGYRLLAGEPALTQEALARTILEHYGSRPALAGPVEATRVDEQLLRLMLLQAAQNARLVEQNDRIIRLLEAAAARR
jgi:hypothetical protein